MFTREQTKTVAIGDRIIGGGNPILIQSMTNTRTEDVAATVAQIKELTRAGCEIIRCTVPTLEAAQAIRESRKYRFRRKSKSCGRDCKGAEYSDPRRCKQWISREGAGGEIPWCYCRGDRGKCS